MKDTLRRDVKDLIGTPRDNAQYISMAFKDVTFSIVSDSGRPFDVTLEGEVEAVDPTGQPVANFETYGTYLDTGRISEIHHDRVALFHVRESGKPFNFPVEVFTSLADVFLWVERLSPKQL